jgi:transglutaminase-like putative cysteine protease
MKTLIACLIVYISAFLFTTPASAQESDFAIDVQTVYTISPNALPFVKHTFSITNLRSQSYPKQYSFQINSNRTSLLTVKNNLGVALPFESNLATNSTLINVKFPEPIVGKGKSTPFTIEYSNPDVAYELGNILEVHIPKISNPENYQTFDTLVVLPVDYPAPSVVYPEPHANETDSSLHIITFTKDQLSKQGAYIAFGDKQYYHVNLTYPLYNPSITPVEFQIVLPPDTSYQKVLISNLDPKPKNVVPDSDGNWIATYFLEAKQDFSVSADLYITAMSKPTFIVGTNYNSLNDYLDSQEYWEVSHPEIVKLAQSYPNAQSIYDYIQNTFKYAYERVDSQKTTRYGAAKAVSNPENSLCLEFADSYVTIARAAKIPSRLLTGYAYSENELLRPLSLVASTLHAWPEYYDVAKKQWHAIDPTWAVTTGGVDYFNSFDTNHIVFSIQGISSSKPLPAGMLPSGLPGGEVAVSFVKAIPEPTDTLNLIAKQPLLSKLGINHRLSISLTNLGNNAVHASAIVIKDSGGITLLTHEVNSLLPFMTYNTTISLEGSTQSPLDISYVNQNQEFHFTTKYSLYAGLLGFVLLTGLASAIVFITLRSRRLLV